MSSEDFTIYTPGIGTLSYTVLISSRENSAHFLQLMPFTIFPIFIPPGTHHCWGGQRRHGMRGFAQHLYTLINCGSTWPYKGRILFMESEPNYTTMLGLEESCS